MDFADQLKKIERWQIGLGVLGFLATLGPGLLTIFLYREDLLTSLDVVKLALLSGAITLPLIFSNITIIPHAIGIERARALFGENGWFLILWCSTLIFYSALLLAYLFALSLKEYLLTVLVCEILVVILLRLVPRERLI